MQCVAVVSAIKHVEYTVDCNDWCRWDVNGGVELCCLHYLALLFLPMLYIQSLWYVQFFTVRLHVMQCTVLLSQFCPSVCLLSVRLSDACIVTKLN